ncbi:hypothetical protein OIU77_008591 [Salix suchowensis]|uniref:Rhamnogalacturonase A/B/Epimerase-like pectate lyase domain-containing protein n=1 Tax=Salix suchowensis TaxID=1278906 RepID=A0ABQ9ACM4_9ROSI|nr:hypothetical protein OIU77_008591 [Salix suchowensis]
MFETIYMNQSFKYNIHITQSWINYSSLPCLGLLILVNGAAENLVYNRFAMLEELESFEIDEEDDVGLFDIPSWTSERGGKVLVNVDSFGAVGDGISDDTQAFVKAWGTACAVPKTVFLVPSGGRYLVNATRFKGPCADNLIIQIDGTIVAPDEPKNWDPQSRTTMA